MALNVGGSDSLYWKTYIDNKGLMAGSTQAKGILAGLSKSITRMDIFAGLAIGSAFIFAKISKQAYNFSKEFETAMKEVETISKAVQNNFKGISKEIIDMSKTVPDNAQKLTKALYQIVSAGYDGAKAMEILRISTELAVATVTDTFTAADVLTYVMNAYGEAAGTAAEISDKLFTIIKLGKVKMEELGPTISMVTGLAAQAGLSFNELAAMYAEAVKKMSPHIVSTGIRGIITAMLRVSKGTGEAADKARELGIEFDISALKSKGFKQILSDIIEKTKGNEAALMSLFPNVRGLIGLLAVMTDEGEGFNKTLEEIENSLGATDKAFKTMVDTTENQLAILRNNVMAKLKPLGDSILKSMNNVARGINQAMSGATDEMTRLSDTYSKLVDTLQRKKSRIDDLVDTIETLRNKTKLNKEETIELEAAEKSLAVYYPNLVAALNGATHSFTILNEAKRDSLKLTKKIAEVELAKAELDVKKANLELTKLRLNKAEVNKEVDELAKKVGETYDFITGIVTRSMEEFLYGMRLYSGDDFTKEIKRLEQSYKEAGIVVENFGERMKEIQKDMRLDLGEEAAEKQKELINDVITAALRGNDEYQNAMDAWSVATGEVTIKEKGLKNIIDEKNISIDAYKKIIEETKEALSKPIITPKPESKYGLPPEILPDKIIPTLTDEQIKTVENRLKYMESQYKKYLTNIAKFTREDLFNRNKLLVEEGEGYAKFLSDSLEEYKDNTELKRQFSDAIFEYNNGILLKRKEAEKDLFNLLANNRAKALAKAKEEYDNLTDKYEEGSTERLDIEKQYRINKEEINEEYDNKEAEARLAIFKQGWEKQIGEEKEAYKMRLEAKLRMLEAEKVIDMKRVEFIRKQLSIIRILEEAETKERKEALDSYLSAYKTTEEKIAAINTETNELIKFADDEVTKNRLDNIRKQRIAEIKASEAKKELDEELAGYEGELNNKQLEEYIIILEKMKIKYKDFTELVILLNEKIADSQKQVWDNIRTEINKTVDAIHALADVVGNFDTELEEAINDMAGLVGGVGQITIGFSTGNIAGIILGIAAAINSIINLFIKHHSDVPELRAELHEITLELQKQQTILSQAIGTAQTEAIQDRIDLLKEQIATYNEMIAAEEAAYGSALWGLITWDETDIEAIEEWLSAIESANAEIAYLAQQYQEILTGTTATSIADAIAEGFSQGLDSAEVFADTFNEMMRKAIIDAFKRTIITKYIEDWYEQFAILSAGGLTAEEITKLMGTFQEMLEAAEIDWAAIEEIIEAAGIGLEELEEELEEAVEEAIEAIAGMTTESIADSIADGFLQGLDSAEVFADTFADMMRRVIIDTFKKTIITKYIEDWYEQFAIFYEGGLTVEEIEDLMGTYQEMIDAAKIQWEAMKTILEAAGINLEAELEEIGVTGLTGAIKGITEETAGLLAGQFQAIRINTVDILSNMENIIIINSQIADNTKYNKYLENIWNSINKGSSLESETLRSIGG